MEKPLVSKKSLLEKYPGKGGWPMLGCPISDLIKKHRSVGEK